MNYIGDYAADSTVSIFFSTNGGDGARIAFSATIEVADFRVYKNVSETERSSQAGWTLNETYDSLVGVHSLSIDLSDNTDAGFYATGNDYTVVLYPDEAVDGQLVSAVLCQFSIENRFMRGTDSANTTGQPGMRD